MEIWCNEHGNKMLKTSGLRENRGNLEDLDLGAERVVEADPGARQRIGPRADPDGGGGGSPARGRRRRA